MEGKPIESRILTDCYSNLPSIIYSDSSQLEIYKDTATTLSDDSGGVVEEIKTIDLIDLQIAIVGDDSVSTCHQPILSIADQGDFGNAITINGSNDLEISIDHTLTLGSYTVTILY